MPGAAQILFASPRLLRELVELDGHLWAILLDFLEHDWPNVALPARVICIHRTLEEERLAGGVSGVHCAGPPYRAVDIGAREFSELDRVGAANALNRRWSYDFSRPALEVCEAKPHGTGPHWHLQSHGNTRVV
jgi:hypothetical protein